MSILFSRCSIGITIKTKKIFKFEFVVVFFSSFYSFDDIIHKGIIRQWRVGVILMGLLTLL